MPKKLSYSLRFPAELRTSLVPSYLRPDDFNWQTNLLFPNDVYANRYPEDDDGGPPSYINEGFLALQNAIHSAFTVINQANQSMPEIQMQRFPTPSFIMNIFATDLQMFMPLFFLMSLNYTFMNTIRFISIEKEKQLKEAMKIMGLASWMHYLSWFIRTIVMLTISMLFITILLTVLYFAYCVYIVSSLLTQCIVIIIFCYLDAVVWCKICNISEFQFFVSFHLLHRLLHLFNYIWICNLCIFHKI